MTKFNDGDKVRIITNPVNWPACSKFALAGAEATVETWVDWSEAMDPYSEFVHVMIDNTGAEGQAYEGVNMIFHEDTLEKIG